MSFGVVLLANGVINLRHHSNLLFRNQFVQHLEEDLGKYAGIVIGTIWCFCSTPICSARVSNLCFLSSGYMARPITRVSICTGSSSLPQRRMAVRKSPYRNLHCGRQRYHSHHRNGKTVLALRFRWGHRPPSHW